MGLAATECSPWADPGKQGLEAAPSPTCRSHLESGPGTGTSDKNVARALNKGSQRGQPGRPHNPHCPRSKTGAQEGAGRTWCQARAAQGPEHPAEAGQGNCSQGRTGSPPPLRPKRTRIL